MSEIKNENITEEEMKDALNAMVNDMVDKLVAKAKEVREENKK